MGNDAVKKDYGNVSAIPTTFVVDKKGVVRHVYVGTRYDPLVLQQHVEELMVEK